VAWPPFLARDGAQATGTWSIVARDDGRMQWARDGKPLYYFAADTKPGDMRGDGQGRVWHVVKAGTPPTRSSAGAYGYRGADYGYDGYSNKP
jgi:hypothetical protein